MSLTKLLKAPIKLFRKENIAFVIIRRYDIGIVNESLRYIAVKPNASIKVLRQKIWHLLDLPDYCDEVIILKSPDDVKIALTELRKGNDPHRPYILEVWLPGKRGDSSTVLLNNMIMSKDDRNDGNFSTTAFSEKNDCPEKCSSSQSAISNEANLHQTSNRIYTDFKKSDISCRISSSSLFRLQGRKSKDNFTNLLLKIQNDLSNLTNKLTVLEDRIST